MKRELRGFLLGLLLAFVWVVLTAGFGGSEGKYQAVMGGSGSSPYVLDTETGRLYLVGGEKWFDFGSPSSVKITPLINK